MLPEAWLAEASSSKIIGGKSVDYGYMFWPVPASKDAVHVGAYQALGIFGQRIYVTLRENLVVAIWSAWPKPLSYGVVDDLDFIAALCAAVR